ncbi:hypothetical protein KBC54_02965 [Patescibacteria group bacterium]|nr:hypothetical protein [Patescibacteria group bacterium]
MKERIIKAVACGGLFFAFIVAGLPIAQAVDAVDTTPPTVSISSPSMYATITGGITISVSAQDNISIKKVVFSIDNWVIQQTKESAPFLFDWNTASLKNGEHLIHMTAYDTSGNVKEASIAVTVSNSTTGKDVEPPTIAIDTPIEGSTLSGNVPVIVRTKDNIGVKEVVFTIDNGIVLGSDTSTAFSVEWDTTDAKDGTHFIHAKAYDAEGNASTTSITVTTRNSTSTLPVVAEPIGPDAHKLVKLPDDGNPLTQEDTAVYYIGADNKRHAFPNANVFFSWYCNFTSVTTISATALAAFPLGANVTYRPGFRMVKFMSSPQTYIVTPDAVLRPISNESVAAALYGPTWNTLIHDIPDTFFSNYSIGVAISNPTDFDATRAVQSVLFPSEIMMIKGYAPIHGPKPFVCPAS